MAEDIRLRRLVQFLSQMPGRCASNSRILSSLRLWESDSEFIMWREKYLAVGVLTKHRARGGGTALADIASERQEPTGPKTRDLSPEARRMLQMIPPDGSSIGNSSLRSKIGLSVEDYWRVRDELLRAGLIQTGKGRGGSVSRTPDSAGEPIYDPQASLVREEKELYEPLCNWLQANWGRETEKTGDFFSVKITAFPSGRSRQSGKWSRPDITTVQVNRFDFLPGSCIEVTSFEVKKRDDAKDVAAVFEAAAHSRWAHNSYLVCETIGTNELIPERILSECGRFGVGLMRIYVTNNGYECKEEVEPKGQTPSPADLDMTLRNFFAEDKRKSKEFRARIGK